MERAVPQHNTATHGITPLLNDPFFEGPPIDPGLDRGFPVAIGGRPFLVDLSQRVHGYRFQRSQVSLLSSQQQASNGDNALSAPEVWRRLQDSWHQGKGQTRLDREDSLTDRFLNSRGIDPWTKYGFSLLHQTVKVLTLPNGSALLVSMNQDVLVAAVNTSLWVWQHPAAPGGPVALTGQALSITTDGVNAYILQADAKVVKVTPAGVVTTYANLPKAPQPGKSFISFMKARLVASAQNSLFDVSGGIVTKIGEDNPIPEFHYVAGTDGLADGYVLGGMGDRWQVHRLTLDTDTFKWSQPIVAAPLPEGEIGYSLGSYLGFVTIGVNTGWRFAVPSGGGDLTYGRLIETKAPVRAFDGEDRFVWYTQDATDAEDAGLGRADLSVFTAPNTPAYADDLEAEGTPFGVVRNVVALLSRAGSPGLRAFTVDGDGVYVETDDYLDQGWLEASLVSFNTNDLKRGVYAQVSWEPRPGRVFVDIAYDSAGWLEIADSDTEGSTGLGNTPIPEQFTGARLRFTLHSAEGASSPRVTRWEIRALPLPGRASEWRIPLILHEALDIDGQVFDADPKRDFDFLLDLVEQRRVFTYRERGRSWQVYATDYVWEPWRETRDGLTYQGLFVMSLRELR